MTGTNRRPRRAPIRSRLLSLAAVTVLAMASLIVTTTPAADAASTFRGWEFTPQVSSTRSDGLALNDVSYNGVRLFERISLPAMNVFYDNDVCGPYVDRIGGSSYDYEPPTEFTQNGVRWLSIGLTDQIGAYVITQMFYLSENGDFDAHIFSKGLQCNIRHDHVPFWRIDFDVAGPGNDEIRRQTSTGMQPMRTEFSMSATAAVNHGWEVHDTSTGHYVTVDFDDGGFNIGGTVVPETDYIENVVHGRQYRSDETRWRGGATYGLFGNNGETIDDAVLWYSGWLPHSPEEGPSLWHSTGIRMQLREPAQQAAAITGSVDDSNGGAVAGAQVDLFTENRAAFVGSTSTGGNGSYRFDDLAAGCYVLTFVAPDGSSFNGNRYQNRGVCVAAGQTSGGNDATVVVAGGGAASVGDRVTYSDGSPAPGVRIDLFSENRAQWLGATTTDGNGNYRFDLAQPMCGVVTFIAPSGQTFVASGGGFLNRAFCAASGQDVTDVDAVLASGASQASLGDRVTNASNGAGVAGVKIVLYRANGDGSRGDWIRDTATDGGGTYRFDVSPGCYVLDFVAPAGRSWTATGGQYLQRFGCVGAGQANNDLDGVLN